MEPVEVNGGTLSLQEVAADNIPTMLSQMRNHFPEAIHAHEYVRMLLRYRKMSPELEISILAPGGDHRLGIIFFLVDEKQLVGSIYCENEQARKAMEEALMSDKLNLPLKESVLLSGMNSNSHLAVKPYIDKNGWSELGGIMYWMPWYTARQLGVHLPEGVEIRKLTPDHADIIDEVWPHKFPGSKEMLVKQITFNFGLGVFRGDDLLSWAIHFFYGGIGAVQTLESEKRKGYGKAVVEAITKKLGELQNDVHLNVVEGNESGEAFFKSLGFRLAFHSQWAGNNLT